MHGGCDDRLTGQDALKHDRRKLKAPELVQKHWVSEGLQLGALSGMLA